MIWWMKGASSHSSDEEGDKRWASRDIYPEGMSARSVFRLVPLQILAVQLLLSFIELPQLLGLAFAQLLPFCVMSGETLREGGSGEWNVFFGGEKGETERPDPLSHSRVLPSRQTWSTCPCLCETFHMEGPSSWPVWPSGKQWVSEWVMIKRGKKGGGCLWPSDLLFLFFPGGFLLLHPLLLVHLREAKTDVGEVHSLGVSIVNISISNPLNLPASVLPSSITASITDCCLQDSFS